MARKKLDFGDLPYKILKWIKDNPEKSTRLALWAASTVTVHRLNLAGIVTWFGRSNTSVETGWPYPFNKRIRFPWEKAPEPTWEDNVVEWALPAMFAYMLVYHPEAVAKFVDAAIPF